jgi:hypothetical protein
MRFFSPTRTAVLLLAAGCGLLPSSALYGQPGALPATQPTAGTAIAVPASALTRAELASHRAEVTYVAGMLEVTASNSSLNQILREISRRTGMKITGGVVDERVYGKYGPGAPGKILSSLLEGTGSNMLLVHNGPELADELILTPRRGGPTPPSPNASSSDDDRSVDLPPQRIVPVSNAVAPLPAPPGQYRPGRLLRRLRDSSALRRARRRRSRERPPGRPRKRLAKAILSPPMASRPTESGRPSRFTRCCRRCGSSSP